MHSCFMYTYLTYLNNRFCTLQCSKYVCIFKKYIFSLKNHNGNDFFKHLETYPRGLLQCWFCHMDPGWDTNWWIFQLCLWCNFLFSQYIFSDLYFSFPTHFHAQAIHLITAWDLIKVTKIATFGISEHVSFFSCWYLNSRFCKCINLCEIEKKLESFEY